MMEADLGFLFGRLMFLMAGLGAWLILVRFEKRSDRQGS